MITRRPSAGVSAPATTAAETSPIECPITASGFHPVGSATASVNANCTPTRTGWMRSIPTDRLPAGEHLVQRKPGLGNKNRFELGHGGGEGRLVGQQLPAHARPTVSPDRNRRTPCPARTAPHGAPRPRPRVARGQCPQPRHRLLAITRTHRGKPGMAGSVVIERVGHIGQGHLARRDPPSSRPTPPPTTATRCAVLPDTTNVHTAGESDLGCHHDLTPAPAPPPHAHSSRRSRTTTPPPGAAAPII